MASKREYWKHDIEEWNTLSFTEYLKDRHEEVFGIPYVPFRGWQTENGMIADWIGTKTKEKKYDKHIVKNFIDECFASYSPTKQYPGTSFGFCYTYRRDVLQRVIAEDNKQKKYEEVVQKQMAIDDILDLL